MKKIFICILIFINIFSIYTFSKSNALDEISYATEYRIIDKFSINNLPNERFYKIKYNCKYLIDEKFDFAILGSNKESIKVVINDKVYLGEIDDPHIFDEPISYFYKKNDQLYLLIAQLNYGTDYRGSNIYKIKNGELIKTDSDMMQVDIVGIDSLLTYKSYWSMGYQTVESKTIINSDGKFERVGVSRFVDRDRFSPSKFYKLKKDIVYNKIINNKVEIKDSVLKAQPEIQLTETDLNSYIDFKTSDGINGRIKIKCIERSGGYIEFKGINNEGLETYFLDDGQYVHEVFDTVEVY